VRDREKRDDQKTQAVIEIAATEIAQDYSVHNIELSLQRLAYRNFSFVSENRSRGLVHISLIVMV
jgi:hypothetical protein